MMMKKAIAMAVAMAMAAMVTVQTMTRNPPRKVGSLGNRKPRQLKQNLALEVEVEVEVEVVEAIEASKPPISGVQMSKVGP